MPDRQQLWLTLADREARLAALIRASAQIVWVADADGRLIPTAELPPDIAELSWPSFCEPAEVRDWTAVVHPEDLPALEALIARARTHGEWAPSEFRIRHASGDWRWVTCRADSLGNPAGGRLGFIGSCTDTTSAHHTQEAYREARRRLLAALDAGGLTTWIWDVTNNKFSWDEAGDKLWGVTGDKRERDLGELVSLIHPDDRGAVIRAAELSVATGVAQSVDFRTKRDDGQLQWLQSRGRMEVDGSGKSLRAFGTFIDITKHRAAEESLRQAQKLQALGTLAGGIAHDFNNLVLAISGNAQLALAELEATHPAHASLREIAKASARAGDVVRRILTFAARQPSEPGVTPLRAAVDEALTLLRSSVPLNVRITTHFSATDAACTLQEVELEQIVVNLVTNAIHAIGDASGEIDIAIDVVAGADVASVLAGVERCARLVVSDSGHGMDVVTRARLFEPFFTTKPQGKGTGLGLAVVHGIVIGAGGAITVTSDAGRGSTFTLWLPLAAASDIAPPPVAIPVAAMGRGERILYVDDDEAITFLIERVLARSGYRITCCDDPRAALRLFTDKSGEFDVVVTDLTMPAMSGFDLIRELRKIRSDVPIIMTSGYVSDEQQARASALGIGRIILKPNTVDELGHELRVRLASEA
jgi:PAS domain S-box-containing protein